MSRSKPAEFAFLALGSNLGDRAAYLGRALARLDEDGRTRVLAASSLYATTPVGMGGEPEFLNAAAAIETEREPDELLALCLGIEARLGRVRPSLEPGRVPGSGTWKSRTIDIDILAYGLRRVDSPQLVVPHPRMKERAFVLAPLAEIAPGWLIDGQPVEAWARLAGTDGVRRLAGPPLWPRSSR